MTKEKTQDLTDTTQIELQEHYQRLDPETRKRLEIESKHFYYPRTKVYKNKYLITNKKTFIQTYARDTREMMARLRAAPLPERFDSSYLKSIHQQIFSKTFAWAGRTRDERFRFPNGSVASMPLLKKKHFKKPFTAGEEIQQGLKKLDEMLLEKDDLQNLTRQELIEHTSQVMLHLYSLNPFREGNRHVIQLFAEKMGQAAGYNFDYSLVSRKRKELIRAEAVNNDNAEPIKHLLEDISNPEKVLILREFVNNMKQLGIDERNYRPTVVAQEGHTYHGTYRGAGNEGFMLDVNRLFVIGHKKDLAPEQVKALKIGNDLSFTAPLTREPQKILIPKEIIPPLSNEELSQRVYENALVKRSIENIETLCEAVYGKKSAVQNQLPKFKIPITDADLEKGEQFAQLIEKTPQSIHKLRGVGVLGVKNSARQHAKENCLPLSQAVFQYIHTLKQAEKEALAFHSAEQKRCENPVEMPHQQMKELFFSSNEKQEEILSSSPELKTQIRTYFQKLNKRLSPREHEIINEENHIKLAESLGIPVSQAQQVAETFRETKEIYNIVQQHNREISWQKERDRRQSITSSDSEKALERNTTPIKAENVVEFIKQKKVPEEKFSQKHQKSMAI